VTPEEEKQLRTEQERYEALLAPTQRKLQALGEGDVAERGLLEANMRPTQAHLLRVLERLECQRLNALQDPVLRGPGTPPPNFVELRLHYATDRRRNTDTDTATAKDPSRHFLGELNADFKDFSFGQVTVTIPTQRRPGELNLPASWRFVGRPDPTRYFVLRSVDEVSREALLKALNEPGGSSDSTLLLFVHGFNVTFTEAALRSAQLAHDLQFPGKVMLYSWPSAGDIASYWKDEDSSRISAPRFRRLLKDLLDTKIQRIFIVAHSMGTRIVIPAVPALASQGVDVSKVYELLLAAADFNEIEFKELAADFAKLRAKGTHLTIYAASNDFALQTSRRIHQYRRLGESDPSLSIFEGLDSVDASAAAPMKRAYGHSYVSDSALVLGDMQDVVLKGLPPKDRALVPIPNTSNLGWKIPKVQ
jgi:esterase/lipase superfamily enzyme